MSTNISTYVSGKYPERPSTSPSSQFSSIRLSSEIMSPSLNDSSPSFSASKSYKARQHGCCASAAAEAAVGLGGAERDEVGGGLESSSSESAAIWPGVVRGMGFGARWRGGRLEASIFAASRSERTPSRISAQFL